MLKTRFLGVTYYVQFWDGERLGQEIAVDTETTLITAEMPIPDLVTTQAYDGGDTVYYIKNKDVGRFLEIHKDRILLFAYFPFDHEVLAKHLNIKFPFKEQIARQQIFDIQMEYRLVHLANAGFSPRKYNLATISRQLLGFELDKSTEIRTTFGDYLEDGTVFYDEIPDDYLIYGALDVIATFKSHQILKGMIQKTRSKTHLTHNIQLVGQLALYKASNRGIEIDVPELNRLSLECEKHMKPLQDVLACYGWARGRTGCNDIRDQILKSLNVDLPRTDSGQISSKTEDLEPYRNNHFVDTYLKFIEEEQKLQYLLSLKSDTGVVHPRYDTLKNTGRTGAFKPNIQNPPRAGGIRELFRAREGHTFFVIDYSFIELCTLAQVQYTNYGSSVLGDIINNGKDPHKGTVELLFGTPYDKVTKEERQKAKALNFGYPGGLGSATFIEYAKKGYGVIFTHSEAEVIKEKWISFLEMRKFLSGSKNYTWTLTGRKRNNVEYCAEKNTQFQGLAADGAKIAMYNLLLNNFNVVAFIHDEVILEEKISDKLEERFDEAMKIMVYSMRQITPDVHIGVEGFICDHWTKNPPKDSEKKFSSLMEIK